MRTLIRLVASLSLLLTGSVMAFDDPPVFSTAGFEADRAAAIEQGRLHLVYATAVWCPPCKHMKKTTWVDPSVESWMNEHAIVSAVDVDEREALARDLGIRAMPTMILFRGDEELGRIQGYSDADELVEWSEALRTGAPVPARGGMVAGGNADAVRQKLDAANDLLRDERYDEATDAYAELWDTMLDEDPAFYGVRLSYMVTSMTFLAEFHPPALERFTELRDREDAKLRAGEVDWDTLADWVHLNGVIGDEASTMRWVERIAARDNAGRTLARFNDEITEQATEIGRWDIVALAVPDPVATAREQVQFMHMIRQLNDEADALNDPAGLEWYLRPPVIAALHAGDDGAKERELIAYLDEAFGEHDAWRLSFIRIASECDRLRDDHTAWIGEFDLDEQFPEQAELIGPEF
ncbi:MAG: thioredoxin family protein [Phycisphaerales bacterium]